MSPMHVTLKAGVNYTCGFFKKPRLQAEIALAALASAISGF